MSRTFCTWWCGGGSDLTSDLTIEVMNGIDAIELARL